MQIVELYVPVLSLEISAAASCSASHCGHATGCSSVQACLVGDCVKMQCVDCPQHGEHEVSELPAQVFGAG